MTTGFIKLNRSAETLELLNDPNAFALLTVIALRARRTDEFNIHNLEGGRASPTLLRPQTGGIDRERARSNGKGCEPELAALSCRD